MKVVGQWKGTFRNKVDLAAFVLKELDLVSMTDNAHEQTRPNLATRLLGVIELRNKVTHAERGNHFAPTVRERPDRIVFIAYVNGQRASSVLTLQEGQRIEDEWKSLSFELGEKALRLQR